MSGFGYLGSSSGREVEQKTNVTIKNKSICTLIVDAMDGIPMNNYRLQSTALLASAHFKILKSTRRTKYPVLVGPTSQLATRWKAKQRSSWSRRIHQLVAESSFDVDPFGGAHFFFPSLSRAGEMITRVSSNSTP
ncbi:hypothetical protein MUK42_33871 [Musa troglodytarum]|uniref:Uncharacterized protein n=1 Tax=Musa troglodytarum TaxID=320322 RepID=A0A9E7EEL3_9LILI|nr:hypothetical protein MUK42_33871 [Musa troglodytarum]